MSKFAIQRVELRDRIIDRIRIRIFQNSSAGEIDKSNGQFTKLLIVIPISKYGLLSLMANLDMV